MAFRQSPFTSGFLFGPVLALVSPSRADSFDVRGRHLDSMRFRLLLFPDLFLDVDFKWRHAGGHYLRGSCLSPLWRSHQRPGMLFEMPYDGRYRDGGGLELLYAFHAYGTQRF